MAAEEETITFRHDFSLNIQGGFANSHNVDTFNTIHGATGYEWFLTLGMSRLYRFGGTRGAAATQLALEPPQRLSSRRPRPVECTFSVRVVDGAKNEVHPTLTVRAEPASQMGEIGFKAPLESEASQLVERIFGSRSGYTGKTLEVVTVLCLPLANFTLHTDYDRIASAPPVVDDFRFKSIRDVSLHNFTFHCHNGGRVTYPKEALFHVSYFFRLYLMHPANLSDLHEMESALAVKQVVDYMLTDTFAHTGEMTTEHARQLFMLSSKYGPMNSVALHNAIERYLLLQMDQHRDQLDVVVRHYVLACERDLKRLMDAALALIVSVHFNQYSIEYGQPTSENTANHEMINRLVKRPGIFRPAPQIRLNQMRRSVENVRCVKS